MDVLVGEDLVQRSATSMVQEKSDNTWVKSATRTPTSGIDSGALLPLSRGWLRLSSRTGDPTAGCRCGCRHLAQGAPPSAMAARTARPGSVSYTHLRAHE